jgi:hypothetical protein
MDDSVAMRSGAIIAGRFDTFDDANAAKARLVEHGFAEDAISVFFNNPPGRHDVTEIGGDEHADPEAKKAAGGAVAGAAAGAGLGLAALATGPFGVAALAATGAYVGALAGAVNATDEAHHQDPLRRPSGVMLAALADGREDETIVVLREFGADHIERAHGTLTNGDWSDFDPVAVPQLVDAQAPGLRNPEAHP